MIDFAALIGTLSHPILFVREPSGPFLTNGCRAPSTADHRHSEGAERSNNVPRRESRGPRGPRQLRYELLESRPCVGEIYSAYSHWHQPQGPPGGDRQYA